MRSLRSGPSGNAGAIGSRKRGIAYGSNSDADLAALSAGIGWWYNWSPKPDATLMADYQAIGVAFVPMIWGGNFDTTQLDQEVPAQQRQRDRVGAVVRASAAHPHHRVARVQRVREQPPQHGDVQRQVVAPGGRRASRTGA